MARCNNGLLRDALIGYESEKVRVQAAIMKIQAQLGHVDRGDQRLRQSDGGLLLRREGR